MRSLARLLLRLALLQPAVLKLLPETLPASLVLAAAAEGGSCHCKGRWWVALSVGLLMGAL